MPLKLLVASPPVTNCPDYRILISLEDGGDLDTYIDDLGLGGQKKLRPSQWLGPNVSIDKLAIIFIRRDKLEMRLLLFPLV